MTFLFQLAMQAVAKDIANGVGAKTPVFSGEGNGLAPLSKYSSCF